jgi:hypothetical protein
MARKAKRGAKKPVQGFLALPLRKRKQVPSSDLLVPIIKGFRDRRLFPSGFFEPMKLKLPERRADNPLDPPPRRRGRLTTHDWHSIDGEIARRCINQKTRRLEVPKNENKLAEDILNWLSERGIDPPVPSEMREAVKRICAALRTV